MEDWALKKNRIAAYYEGLIGRYGYDPRACDYGRAESQRIKFSVLSDVLPMNNKSVLDVGCGFADFAGFLNERFTGVRYEGIDLTSSMIKVARERHPGINIRQADILETEFSGRFDVVTANGIFYLMGDGAENLMRQLITRMFSLCGEAVAFNSLSNSCADQEPGEFYADPGKTLDFCRALTPYVMLRQDYHSRDFTIYMYRSMRQVT